MSRSVSSYAALMTAALLLPALAACQSSPPPPPPVAAPAQPPAPPPPPPPAPRDVAIQQYEAAKAAVAAHDRQGALSALDGLHAQINQVSITPAQQTSALASITQTRRYVRAGNWARAAYTINTAEQRFRNATSLPPSR
jgi:hypothetical protein